ncbi:MADS-box transcription factor 15-like [Hibiscus syriacus]|uniref:MADS-box transcription factor 15-like n=1 Tax=Hibiscus syriacus TaxID=106335 RepID=UPI001924D3F1|nr:MADS-box transcription factor 15-like [Hibiscus syriacus]
MARRKLRMKLIDKEKTRSATLKKRLQSLEKKAYEFSVLCDVDVCMIIFTPGLKDDPPNVQVWPSDPLRVHGTIHRYKRTMAASGSQKRTFSISHFLDMRRRQDLEEVAQVCKANFEAKFPTWDDRIDNFSPEQISSCLAKLDSSIEVVKRKIMLMKGDDKHKLLQSESRSILGSFDARSRPSPSDNFNIPAAALHPWNRNLSDNHINAHAIQAFSPKNAEFGVIREQSSSLPPKSIDIHRPSLSPADEALVKLSLGLNPNDKLLRMSMMNNDINFELRSGIASSSNNSIPNNVMYNTPPFFIHGNPIYGMPNNDVLFDPISSIQVLHDPSRSSGMQNYAMLKEPKAGMGTWLNAAPSMQPAELATAYNHRQQLMMPHAFHQTLPPDFSDDFCHDINEHEMKNKKPRFF